MGTAGIISYPDSGPIGKLGTLFADFAASINQALPVKFVETLAALNVIGLSADSLPAGTLAILVADDSGLAAGAQFSMNPDGRWRLIGSCTALNIDTFVTALAANTNVKTVAGATVWNAVTSSMCVFIDTTGTYDAVTTVRTVSGTGVTTATLANGAAVTFDVAFAPGTFSAIPSNIIVTADSTRPTCAAVTRTASGFSVQLANWSGGAMAAGVNYYWTALA